MKTRLPLDLDLRPLLSYQKFVVTLSSTASMIEVADTLISLRPRSSLNNRL